jgi:hypothetical protein
VRPVRTGDPAGVEDHLWNSASPRPMTDPPCSIGSDAAGSLPFRRRSRSDLRDADDSVLGTTSTSAMTMTCTVNDNTLSMERTIRTRSGDTPDFTHTMVYKRAN